MIRKPQKGFTLIELVIVFSIMSALSAFSIAGFINYNRVQILQSATDDLVTALNLAKSRASSQVKIITSQCPSSNTLSGYEVKLLMPNQYQLKVYCISGSNSNDFHSDIYPNPKTLPKDISFDCSGTCRDSFFFPVLTGGLRGDGKVQKITLKAEDGNKKTIMINSLGGISVQ